MSTVTSGLGAKSEKPDYSVQFSWHSWDFKRGWVHLVGYPFFTPGKAGQIPLALAASPLADAIDAAVFGSRKYSEIGGWRKIPDGYRVFRAAASRHLKAELDSPGSLDEESGLPHTSHFLANVLFALWHLEHA